MSNCSCVKDWECCEDCIKIHPHQRELDILHDIHTLYRRHRRSIKDKFVGAGLCDIIMNYITCELGLSRCPQWIYNNLEKMKVILETKCRTLEEREKFKELYRGVKVFFKHQYSEYEQWFIENDKLNSVSLNTTSSDL